MTLSSQHFPSATDVLVMRALLDHGGRVVYSCTLDELGRTVGAPVDQRKPYHCSVCGETGHTIRQHNAEAARARVREVIARHGGDKLDETRRILRERAEARRAADELARYGRIADAVKEALPVDEEADRAVTRALSERSRNYIPRKL